MLSYAQCPVAQCVRHLGEEVCCSVVFGTLVGVFSVMWSELLMTSAISCPLCTSAREWSVRSHLQLQTTQPTCGGAVTVVTNCCANCVKTSCPQH